MNSTSLLTESTVYAFHVTSLNAIKVGYGYNGRSRMRTYSRQYTLETVETSLREWRLPSPNLASAVETACHRALLESNFHRLSHIANDIEAQELFDLGNHNYEDAVLIVAGAIEETIATLHAALTKYKPLSGEKARQQREEAQRQRDNIKSEKKARQQENDNQLIRNAIQDFKKRWDLEVAPFIQCCNEARAINKSFPRDQGLLSSIWLGKVSSAKRMQQWDRWENLKQLSIKLFHLTRKVKYFQREVEARHGKYAALAAKELGLSLHSPGGHIATGVSGYSSRTEQGFVEVRLAVQLASGLNGIDSEELVKSSPDLITLVKFATINKPPEIC